MIDDIQNQSADISPGVKQNRLLSEKSPYLLQHATNPVDWYPWNEAAFVRARRENKPVFLSIGYSTCHWCHVMERESFENKTVAELLNRVFIAVKVDREERPDIDNIYMTVCQMLTGSGGWPLTLVLTPEKEPFFAATYLPRERRSGMPGLVEILTRIADAWRRDESGIRQSGGQITQSLRRYGQSADELAQLSDAPLKIVLRDYQAAYDRYHGGFGTAPKFPATHNLGLLLRLARRYRLPEVAEMALHTLRQIRRGGIYDQLSYGIHRYSVDARWLVPHFEKMLYDQAMLILACVDAWQYSSESGFRTTALETAEYLLGEMIDPCGAFHSGEDADSEGEEGTYYIWTRLQIETLLGRDAELFCRAFGVTTDGNFDGSNVLWQPEESETLAVAFGMAAADLEARLDQCRRILLAARQQRIRPHRDDKILTAWNGLTIAALARAGAVFDRPPLTAAARRAAKFIFAHMRRADGRLLRRWRQNEAAMPGFLEDYTFFVWGLLELYMADFVPEDLQEALTLTEQMLFLFDDGRGGLYDTAADAEIVLDRVGSLPDGALPSGSAVAALNLLRLGRLCDRSDLEERGERLLQNGMATFLQQPRAYAQHLTALDLALAPPTEVVVTPGTDQRQALVMSALRKLFIPEAMILAATDDDASTALIPALADKPVIKGETMIYVCRNRACQAPVTTIAEALRLLKGDAHGPP